MATVPIEEAMARLDVIENYDPGDGEQPCVHTFRRKTLMLGAHWPVEKIRKAFEEFGVIETDGMAKAMGHGLGFVDDTGPVIVATKEVEREAAA